MAKPLPTKTAFGLEHFKKSLEDVNRKHPGSPSEIARYLESKRDHNDDEPQVFNIMPAGIVKPVFGKRGRK